MLRQDETGCISSKKVSPLCETCKRNLSLSDSVNHFLWSEWTPNKVKKLGNGHTFKCDGYFKNGDGR